MIRTILLVVVVFIGVSLGYCYVGLAQYIWHQKMTIEVEVNGQLYTGSSVVKVMVKESEPLTKQLGYPLQFGAKGEAAYVELPGRRYLFALLGGGPSDSGPQTNALNIFQDQLPRKGLERFAVLSTSRFKTDIPRSHYPLLVAFMDINDPNSVREIDPDNLAATFGPGVSLKRITLEITDEPVTEGKIESVLGWWLAQATGRLDPPPFHIPDDSPRGYDTVGISQIIIGKK